MTDDEYADTVVATHSDEALIWAHDGAWYQYRDEQRQLQLCHLGFVDSFRGLCDYAEEHGIPVFRLPERRPDIPPRPRIAVRARSCADARR